LVGKSAGNRPPGKTALGSKDYIKMGPKANRWQNIDWLHLAQDSDQLQVLTKTVMHFRTNKKCGEFLSE